jgi:hypothetical protein
MKQLALYVLALVFLLKGTDVCAQADKVKTADQKTKTKSSVKKGMNNDMRTASEMENGINTVDMTGFPYKPLYSTQFAPGNPAYSHLVMSLWKSFEDKDFNRDDAFADSLAVQTPNGMMIHGKDSVLQMYRKARESYTTFTLQPEAWMSMRSIDRNENWVLVWGVANISGADGAKKEIFTHQLWRINKDGKVDFIREYDINPSAERR